MLQNFRRKSLVRMYQDSSKGINFEKGHARIGDLFCLDWHQQRLAKNGLEHNFPSTLEDVSKKFCLFSNEYKGFELNMILCPQGSFVMGHKDIQFNQPKIERINKAFLLGETEITQGLYKQIMGEIPREEDRLNPRNPIRLVSWFSAILFCNRLSLLQNLTPCYTVDKISYIHPYTKKEEDRIFSAIISWDENADGYRLPTEKEWEYAANANTGFQWAGTDVEEDLGDYALYRHGMLGDNEESTNNVQVVKKMKPNAWGFYDMSGNVSEWCWNKFNPMDMKPDANRVTRGGSGVDDASETTISYRAGNHPSDINKSLGFRVCRSIVN